MTDAYDKCYVYNMKISENIYRSKFYERIVFNKPYLYSISAIYVAWNFKVSSWKLNFVLVENIEAHEKRELPEFYIKDKNIINFM